MAKHHQDPGEIRRAAGRSGISESFKVRADSSRRIGQPETSQDAHANRGAGMVGPVRF